MKKIAVLAAAAAIVLSGCSEDAPEAEVFEPRPVPESVYGDSGSDSRSGKGLDELTDADIDRMALEMTWESMSSSDQRDVCMGIDIFGAAYAADEYFDHADRDVVIEFFEEVC